MEIQKPTQHRMTRRSAAHDYTRTGIYHITLHVAEGLGAPLGTVVGSLSAPDGSPDAPRTALTPVGAMVERELLTAIHARYPMIEVQDYVIMPEHIHLLIVVQDVILSANGKHLPLGQVIAGFKKGCNRRYWELMDAGGKTAGHTSPNIFIPPASSPAFGPAFSPAFGPAFSPAFSPASGPAFSPASGPAFSIQAFASAVYGGSVSGGFPAGFKVSSSAASGRQPLFAPGYCDVMPVDARQQETQRAYIKGNPRSRLLRSSNHAWLHTQRGGITTALTPAALRGYLQRECPPYLATPEALADIEARLLISSVPTAPGTYSASRSVSGGIPAGTRPLITCDAFGNRALLTEHRCLPVVCHRKDASRFGALKARCLEEAQRGTTLVSARIAKGEQEIIDEAVNRGFSAIIIHDNGFPDRYHPSKDRLDLCGAGRLLLITPWRYEYRPKDAPISVPACKTMNCVAQALCRTKDTWWQ